jgi:hypothetical protein
MRREYLSKPKAKETVPLPIDLREFLQEVHQLIEDGDEAAIYESDDMLQAESVYGGLTEEGGTCYGFTYFSERYTDIKPEEAGEWAEWELSLEKSEIAEIAAGEKFDLVLWACQVPLCRNKFSNPLGICFNHDRIGNSA